MDLNYSEFYERMERELQTSSDFATSMLVLIDWLQERFPHSHWEKLKALKFDADLNTAKAWLEGLLQEHPSDFNTRALYVGISEEYEEDSEGELGPEYADLYLVLFSQYDPNDDSMAWIYGTDRFDYDYDRKANLAALKSIGVLCNQEQSIGSNGYIALSVAFAVLLLKHVPSPETFAHFPGGPVGVVTGFGSGDLFKAGELNANGLSVALKS